jgi:hypothetical protein
VLKLSEHSFIDPPGRHERKQDRDVGRHAERRTGVEECPVLSHDRVGLRDLHDQAALGTARPCHGGTIVRRRLGSIGFCAVDQVMRAAPLEALHADLLQAPIP